MNRTDLENVCFDVKKAIVNRRSPLVETIGVEPMTSCMSSMRSNQLSYASEQTTDIL